MTEAVRFYWRGRESGVPLAAIPEQDRHPLRIRRSVVQAHAPAVVEQLAAGRFLVAAWEFAGQISLILVHPNVAKGPAGRQGDARGHSSFLWPGSLGIHSIRFTCTDSFQRGGTVE
jgi:hypothetical protein